jgi:hypothetical protein
LGYNKKRFLATVVKEPSATGGTPETVLYGTLKSVLVGSALDGVGTLVPVFVILGTLETVQHGIVFVSPGVEIAHSGSEGSSAAPFVLAQQVEIFFVLVAGT